MHERKIARWALAIGALMGLAGVFGCTSIGDPPVGCTLGTLGCACTAEGTCGEGLVCSEGVCEADDTSTDAGIIGATDTYVEPPPTACITILDLYRDTGHTVLMSTERYCDEFGGDCESGSGAYTEFNGRREVGQSCASQGYTEHCTGNGLWYQAGEVPDVCTGISGCEYSECIAAGNTPAYCERCLD